MLVRSVGPSGSRDRGSPTLVETADIFHLKVRSSERQIEDMPLRHCNTPLVGAYSAKSQESYTELDNMYITFSSLL